MADSGDQEKLRVAVEQHRRLRRWAPYRMYLVDAPTETSRVYAARLEHGHLLREVSWKREERRRVRFDAVVLVDEHGEVQARREW